MKKPSFFPVLVGTGFGSGFSPFAPGTAGALLATLIWLGLSFIVSEACLIWLTVAFILFFTILGIWAVNRLEPYWGEDPSRVVVDEMGIRRMESFPGGFGVMMDDILAGIYSFVVLIGVRWLIG